MEVEKRFIRNYLSRQKFSSGKLTSWFILTLCFILSLFYWDSSSPISNYLSASHDQVFVNGEYWRLFTTSFVHGDIEHLLSNSLMLFILTYFVTSFYGSFISLGLGFIMGIAINYFVISQYETNTTLVGASGVIYYLWGFWLVLYLCISKHMHLISRFLRIGGIFFILLVPTTYSPSTSYLAHYIGFGVGFITGLIYYLFYNKKIATFEFWEYRVVEEFEDLEEEKSGPSIIQ
jgi:rhomboid protease GluP